MSGKKKDSGKKDGDDKALKDMNDMLSGQISVLKWRIGKGYSAMEQEKSDRSRAGQNECRMKLNEITLMVEDEEKKALQVNLDMKERYRQMMDDKEGKIGTLEDELRNGQKELSDKEKYIRDFTRSKDKEIEDKDNEIRELRKKIDDMSQEFASMLKATLDKMQERIELANTQWDSDLV
jgi:chromosome segregation ATPase